MTDITYYEAKKNKTIEIVNRLRDNQPVCISQVPHREAANQLINLIRSSGVLNFSSKLSEGSLWLFPL